MTIWAIVPAAGIGRRMGSSIPKQYLALDDQPVIAHTLQQLTKVDRIEKIVVVLHPDDSAFQHMSLPFAQRLLTAVGGDERFQSVSNGLQALAEVAQFDDWVLVHDAVRPCVRPADINRLIDTLSEHAVGGLLGVPVNDTLKRVNAKAEVEETVDRTRYWQAQTPQMFRYGLLRDALAALVAVSEHVTDEAGAVERQGLLPVMVEGHADNIKITRKADLALASQILSSQASLGAMENL